MFERGVLDIKEIDRYTQCVLLGGVISVSIKVVLKRHAVLSIG